MSAVTADCLVYLFHMYGINMAVEYDELEPVDADDDECFEVRHVWIEGADVLPILSESVLACIYVELHNRVNS